MITRYCGKQFNIEKLGKLTETGKEAVNILIMTRCILISIFIFCCFTSKSQINYQLNLKNASNNFISVRLNNEKTLNMSPSQIIKVADTISFFKIAKVALEIISNQDSNLVQEIPFVVIQNSVVEIEFYDRLNNRIDKGFKITGLPFLSDQAEILDGYFSKKKEFKVFEKNEYLKKYNPKYSKIQQDSILDIIRQHRYQYLSSVVSFIKTHKQSKASYYIFNAELMNAKNILTLGKQKILDLITVLDTNYYDTDIGQLTINFVQKLKSNTVGAVIKNFKFRTANMDEYELYDLISNSRTLLIFTARGCKGCVAQVPIIKEIEEKHKPNLNIVYVSLDRNVTDWKKSIVHAKYPGVITLNLEPYNYSIDLQDLFMVNFIPQLFLIDKDGKILYDNLSPYEDDDLDRLKEILDITEKS